MSSTLKAATVEDQDQTLQSVEAERIEAELSGRLLYGESLTRDELQTWYEQLNSGFFDRAPDRDHLADEADQHAYAYGAMNHFHAIGTLLRRRFTCCVALGCAAGDDVAPLAPVVDRFLAIEPLEKWWRPEIGGKPARYVMPSIFGHIDLDTGAADLATSFGVLHLIPNVSQVVGEIARVLSPGGLFVVREPISWMGDWRKPRPGLTANERGLPLHWFEEMIRQKGFRVVRRRLCMFRPLAIVAEKFGISRPYATMPITVIDWILSESLHWNVHYRRDGFVRKNAPASALWLLEKQP